MNVNVTVRMDENLKRQADELFADLGMSFSTAVTIFTRQAVREKAIPFTIHAQQAHANLEDLASQFMDTHQADFTRLAQ